MERTNTLAYAKEMDTKDPLREFRDKFYFPTFMNKDVVYFTGNSLGLQPKTASTLIQEELDAWAKYGVEGHFLAERPWFAYHENLTELTAKIVGAKNEEVVVTHSLTTNLHLLMVSFFQPEGKRKKIICEAKGVSPFTEPFPLKTAGNPHRSLRRVGSINHKLAGPKSS